MCAYVRSFSDFYQNVHSRSSDITWCMHENLEDFCNTMIPGKTQTDTPQSDTYIILKLW